LLLNLMQETPPKKVQNIYDATQKWQDTWVWSKLIVRCTNIYILSQSHFFKCYLLVLFHHTYGHKVVILMVLNIWWSKLLYFNILNIFLFIEIDGNQNIKLLKEYVIFVIIGTLYLA
jgi:hypothetical protein